MRNLKIIYLYTHNSLQTMTTSIPVVLIFFFSKLIRYGLFAAFLYLMASGLEQVGGYSREQMLIFYLSFNLVDTAAQMLFREVYRFRPLIVTGGFDMVLSKPMNPLARVLMGGPDFIDLGIFVILLGIIIYTAVNYIHPTFVQVFSYFVMILASLVMAASFHILVLAMGIVTTSVDHLTMIYRDLSALVRIPVDFFTQPLRTLITFVLPLGLMFTFPAKVFLGLASPATAMISVVASVVFFWLAIKFWNYSLKNYQSASS